jgi:phosphoglycolate phosphatase-like HAD superfamily hydrolase
MRIGFDMDGVLADFASAFYAIERHLFGSGTVRRAVRPEEEAEDFTAGGTPSAPGGPVSLSESRRRRDAVWQLIKSTNDFWTLLKPTQQGAVRRIRDLSLQHRWEVFFVTQRPATLGETVQRQTQRWLIAQGFDMPSVLVIGGSRGAAAGALRLDYHVDDSAQNCLDVLSDAHAKPMLIVPAGDAITARKARSLGIGVVSTIGECLDVLDQVSTGRQQPVVLQKLAAMVGWSQISIF